MKLNKFFLGLLGLSAMVMTSCSDSDDYQWASITGGDQVYFSNTLPTTLNLSMSETKFTIPVNRVTTTNAATVNISLTSDDNFLSAPSSVSFPAGASTADLVVTYDPQALGYDNFKKAVFKITDESQTNAYGYSTYSISAGIPSPYKSLGKGVYLDDYYFGASSSVTIMQNQENKNAYRIMAPYKSITGGGDDYLEITLLQPGNKVGDVTITQSGLVLFKSFNTGYHHSTYDADIWIHHPSAFKSLQNESSWLYSKVIAYKEDGTPGQIQLAPYYYMDGVGGWNATQGDGNIVITFPGYAPKDMSAEIEYLGVLTDVTGAASAAVNLTFGADVADARAIVVSADADADAVADAIAAGDVEAIPVTEGTNYVAIGEGLTGKLMVVLVILDEGAVKNVSTINFEYYGGGVNPWESLGIGLFTDDLVYPLFTEDGSSATYEVEIEANTDEPGIYRLVDPYGASHPYYQYAESYTKSSIEVNAADPDGVYILEQSTGLDLGEGLMSIVTEGGDYLAYYGSDYYDRLKGAGYFGKLKDGIITFPSFERKNDAGEVQYTYQGWVLMGESGYRMGRNGELKIVLPSAVPAAARLAAQSQAKARNFEKRLKGDTSNIKARRLMMRRNAPLIRDIMLNK